MILSKLKTISLIIRTIKNWPTWFIDSLGLSKGDFVNYKLRAGTTITARARTADSYAIMEVWAKKDYNPPGFEIGQEDVVIDIGAHIGAFSLLASSLAKRGKVFSIEPIDDNFRLMVENLKANRICNVTPINKAMSDQKRIISIFLHRGNTGGHSIYQRDEKMEKIDVDALSLNDLIKDFRIQTIDFLKIDCEGGEYDILFNTSDEVFGIIKRISLEFHNIDSQKNPTILSGWLASKGYNIRVAKPPIKMLYAKKGE